MFARDFARVMTPLQPLRRAENKFCASRLYRRVEGPIETQIARISVNRFARAACSATATASRNDLASDSLAVIFERAKECDERHRRRVRTPCSDADALP
jgi:hypothetical protein